MVQILFNFAAEAAAAVGVPAAAGVHQQQDGALQLLCPVLHLLVVEVHVGLIDLLCLGLQHTDLWA